MLERIKLPCTEKQCDQAWNVKSYYFDRALKKFCAKKQHQRIEKGMCNRKHRFPITMKDVSTCQKIDNSIIALTDYGHPMKA